MSYLFELKGTGYGTDWDRKWGALQHSWQLYLMICCNSMWNFRLFSCIFPYNSLSLPLNSLNAWLFPNTPHDTNHIHIKRRFLNALVWQSKNLETTNLKSLLCKDCGRKSSTLLFVCGGKKLLASVRWGMTGLYLLNEKNCFMHIGMLIHCSRSASAERAQSLLSWLLFLYGTIRYLEKSMWKPDVSNW